MYCCGGWPKLGQLHVNLWFTRWWIWYHHLAIYEEGLLIVDENREGHAAAFGDDIAIECLATEFKREIYVVSPTVLIFLCSWQLKIWYTVLCSLHALEFPQSVKFSLLVRSAKLLVSFGVLWGYVTAPFIMWYVVEYFSLNDFQRY